MKIILIWPKSTFLSVNDQWPPLGLWYLAARLESLGHETNFIDLNFEEMPKDGEYDQMWVSCTSPQIKEARRIGEETKNWKTKRILGGALPWASPESAKQLDYDLIVGGEADSLENINKVLELIENPPQDKYFLLPNPKGLDWVLPPVRRWANKYKSYMSDDKGNKYKMMSVFGARGCAFHCSFCESSSHGVIWSRLTRYEPLWCIEKQFKEAVELGFTGIAWYDDVFIMNKRRTLEILELHKKYNLVWRCFLRSDLLCKHGGKEYLKQMKDSGLIEIFVGIESADNEIKKNIDKGTTIEQDDLVLEWCRELGVRFKGSFILGLPGESMKSMQKTRDWILKQDPKGIRIQVGRLIPFKGTPLGDHPEKYDLNYEFQPDENWFYAGDKGENMRSFVSTSNLSVDEIDLFWRKLQQDMKVAGIHG